MFGIKDSVVNEYVIQKSKFIAVLSPINQKEEVVTILEHIKTVYPGANHYCYAYICNQEKRANDDGEPSGAAGNPILNILENNHLNGIICIVIRYFGGIKLGAAGLIRAYGKATKLAIEKAEIGKRIPAVTIESIFSYENLKQMNYLLKDAEIITQSFGEQIDYQYILSEEQWQQMKNEINKITISSHIINHTYQIIS